MPKVKDVIDLIEEIAKPEYAYEWDNCGFACGNRNAEVENVLITLDITKEVVLEAANKNCQMIISHHPLIFHPIKTADEDTYEGGVLSSLFKNGIALYCAHTSLDVALCGVNDALCEKLGLKNVELLDETEINGETVSCGRIGELEREIPAEEFVSFLKKSTGAKKVLTSGLNNKKIKSVALCTGAGEDMAFIKKADVFVTGEVKYHTALELKRQNIAFAAIGHYFSEVHIAKALCGSLQKRANVLQYNLRFIPSETNTNPFDC